MTSKRGDISFQMVLLIIALVALVFFVFLGSEVFAGGIAQLFNFGGGDVNVQDIVVSCGVSCSTGSQFDYCTRLRSVVFTKNQDAQSLTCKQLEPRGVGLDVCTNVDCGITSGARGTCNGPVEGRCSIFQIRQDCEFVNGCNWQITDPQGLNPNVGNCNVDPTFGCDVYNNNQELCGRSACIWQPLGDIGVPPAPPTQ